MAEPRHPRRRRRPGRARRRSSASSSTGTPGTTTSSATASAAEARDRLAQLHETGSDVAVVLAGQEVDGPDAAASCSAEVRRLHPHAKRALLVGWGEWGFRETGDAILEAIEHGKIDHYVVRPVAPPDELFHHSISTFLLEWAEERRTAPYAIQVVGDSWSGRAAELRDVLERCAFPHAFCLADSDEGRRSWRDRAGRRELPVVILPDGDHAHQPERRRAHARDRVVGRARRGRGRPADRRRRARGAVGRRLRRLRGASHADRRHARHRGTGTVELADPELPRVSSRRERRRARPPGATSRRGCSARGSPSCST